MASEKLAEVCWGLKESEEIKGFVWQKFPCSSSFLRLMSPWGLCAAWSMWYRLNLEARDPLRSGGQVATIHVRDICWFCWRHEAAPSEFDEPLLTSHARASRSRFREWVIFKSLGRVCSRRDCRESPANPTDNQRLLRLSQKKCVTSWVKWALVEPSRSALCGWIL